MNIQVQRKTEPLTLKGLTYSIYDYQRQIMQSIEPKRFECVANVSIRRIQELINFCGPQYWLFDGMNRDDATHFHQTEAARSGIINPHMIPLILSKRITCHNPHFRTPTVVIETDDDGFRQLRTNILHEVATMINRRSIFSNLAYALHKHYGVNLHLGFKDVRNAESMLGNWSGGRPMRGMFEEACTYYTTPSLLSPNEFLRCQVKELRELPDDIINNEVSKLLQGTRTNFSETIETEIKYAIQIHEGTLINWYGDLT